MVRSGLNFAALASSRPTKPSAVSESPAVPAARIKPRRAIPGVGSAWLWSGCGMVLLLLASLSSVIVVPPVLGDFSVEPLRRPAYGVAPALATQSRVATQQNWCD